MRRLLFILVALCSISVGGCAAIAEGLIDAIFDTGGDKDREVNPAILKRKGIEPGSRDAKRLYQEMNREW